LRSNGYSLARRILVPRAGLLDDPAWDGAGVSLADELLRPSVIYSPALATLRRSVPVHGLAHITGGGIPGNLVRVLPAAVDAVVRMRAWPVPRVFDEIQRRGEVAADEMARVFNLGIGMIVVVAPDDVDAAVAVLRAEGHDALVIGAVVAGEGRVHLAR
jgi:phosphoribosylformylglycinamidine cyclo-ligase